MNIPSSGEYPRMQTERQAPIVPGVLGDIPDTGLEIRLRYMDFLKRDILTHLYLKGDTFDPFVGDYPKDKKEFQEIRTNIQELSIDEQRALADWFFSVTIGKHISNNREAYKVYYLFKGSPFSARFHELEDTRLKEAGYSSGFIL